MGNLKLAHTGNRSHTEVMAVKSIPAMTNDIQKFTLIRGIEFLARWGGEPNFTIKTAYQHHLRFQFCSQNKNDCSRVHRQIQKMCRTKTGNRMLAMNKNYLINVPGTLEHVMM